MRSPFRKKSNEKFENEENDGSDQEELEAEGILSEVAKVLRIKRWEAKQGPFRGFGSPPGKF